jgi:hypothetical protein
LEQHITEAGREPSQEDPTIIQISDKSDDDDSKGPPAEEEVNPCSL